MPGCVVAHVRFALGSGPCFRPGAGQSLNSQEIEDVAIEAITTLIEKIDQITEIGELKPLVATIAHNKAVSLARQKFGLKHGGGQILSIDYLREENDFDPVEDKPKSFSDDHDAALVLLHLHEALAQLKPPFEGLLRDRYFNDQDYRTLAATVRNKREFRGLLYSAGACGAP